jgi:DeoR/GlpR family transcriptional regulator of sugar metabolism
VIVTIVDNQEEAVVADGSKIGKVAFARTGEVAAVSELIRDRDAGPEAAEVRVSCPGRCRILASRGGKSGNRITR